MEEKGSNKKDCVKRKITFHQTKLTKCIASTASVGGFGFLVLVLKRANEWYFVSRLGENQSSLPPGDMGWPFIGNTLSFIYSLKYDHPDSFVSNYVKRYGQTGIYKAYLFGKPTIIATAPEICRKILTNDTQFKAGWPKSITKLLLGKLALMDSSAEEHKRLRKLTAAPISGHKALSMYHEYIKDVVVTSLDEWSKSEEPIEFLTEIRKLFFKIVVHIFLSSEIGPMLDTFEKDYTALNHGLRSMAINLPGFAYHNALKARKRLVKTLQVIVDRRRERKEGSLSGERKYLLDLLLEAEDETGRKLYDEEIIDIILMYLNAGHESSAHATMWATLFLHQHPEYYQKAKAEQEEILNSISPENGLSFKETKQMKYLSKVIDETMRVVNISLYTYREATADVNISGYTIPKGWKVMMWFRGIHLDPEIYQDPKEFNPSRWNESEVKAGTYIPFGIGSRLCPGIDLTKLEITTFLHYFLLNYKLERLNPGCKVKYLPHARPEDNCLGNIKKLP